MYARKHSRRTTAATQTRDVLLATLAACQDEVGGVASAGRAPRRQSSGITGVWLQELVSAADLHDIGKLAVPASILAKPGRLTDDEW